jgi:plastocyanin
MPAGRRCFGDVAVLVATVLLAACTNAEPTINKAPHPGVSTASSNGGVQQVRVTTGVDLRFHPSTIVVHPGKVRIVLVNDTGKGVGPPHDLDILGIPGATVPLVQPRQTREVTFTAPSPGRYHFVCTIHAKQGQTGVLVVRKS